MARLRSSLHHWTTRRDELNREYVSLPKDKSVTLSLEIERRLSDFRTLLEPEIRPGNGIDKVIERERALIQIEVMAESLANPSEELEPYLEDADGKHPGMVFIPPGEASIGSDRGFFSRDEPARRSTLRGYWIDVYPVCNCDFEKLFPRHVRDLMRSPADMMPVVNVTWFDAHKYCAAIGKRLPIGDQWERAARGSNGLLYSFGNEFDRSKVHVWPADGASAVDAYEPNSSGLYHMSGNVWEWTREVHVHALDEHRRILYSLARGGSWRNCQEGARATSQLCLDLALRADHVGFRGICGT